MIKFIKRKRNEDDSKENNKTALWFAVTFIIVLIMIYFIVNASGVMSSALKPEQLNDGISTQKQMSSFEVKEFKEGLSKKLSELKSSNTYVLVNTSSDTTDAYLYNKKGEVVCNSASMSSTEVFRKDKSPLIFDSNGVNEGTDIDVLTLTKSLVDSIGSNGIYVTKVSQYDSVSSNGLGDISGNDRFTSTDYVIHVDSYEGIEKIYGVLGSTGAQAMVSNLKSVMGGDWTPDFRYYITFKDGSSNTNDNSDILSVSCYVNDGSADYVSWYFDGYLTLGDWDLTDDWYTTNFNDSSDESTYTSMLNRLVSDLKNMMTNYVSSHDNLVLQEEYSETSTENN